VLRRLFGTAPITLGQWALALAPAVLLIFLWELGKLIARRRQSSNDQ
jgi:Ca2+-transporting ATPase